MNAFGNIIWLVFGGFFTAMGYILGGLLLCLTIIGIPFGKQSIRIGVATLAPFGTEVVEDKTGDGFVKLVFDVIWLLVVGWEIALAHLISGGILAITIVGLPFAKQHFKLIPVSLFPFRYDLQSGK